MKRSPLKRGKKALARGKAKLARKPMKRTATKRWTPGTRGKAFNRAMIDLTRKRDGLSCTHCFVQVGTDCAHVWRLGAGASWYDWRDWRNWSACRVMLCRSCHVALDTERSWSYTAAARTQMQIMAQRQMEMCGAKFERRAA